MKAAVRAAAEAGMPIYAECGGFMYLTRSITDFDGKAYAMCGAVPLASTMNGKLRTVGYVTAEALKDIVIAPAGAQLRGHEFHFSSMDEAPADKQAFLFTKNRTGERYPGGWADKNILGSYLHLHFAGYPEAAARFVEKCAEFRAKSG